MNMRDSHILDAIAERYAVVQSNCIRCPELRDKWLGEFAFDVKNWLDKRKPAPHRRWWQR